MSRFPSYFLTQFSWEGGVIEWHGGYLSSSQGEAAKNDEDRVKSLWIRIRWKANKADILVGVCHRPCNQEEEVNELFSKQLADTSQSLALVFLGDFILPDVC